MAKHPDKQTRESFLRSEMRELAIDIDGVRSKNRDTDDRASLRELAPLLLRQHKTRDALDEEVARKRGAADRAAAAAAASKRPEEFEQELVEDLLGLPADMLMRVIDAVTSLRLVEGG